ncbi:hydroxyglutarate oxidase [Arthrobacter sp. StoSoilB3]|uniref:L-2-hydroxyglutarate oxidase n=1 Tax=Paenarthrobacter nicotinovorans TaxID=29320 RepID=UPI00166655AA|nr:L-2-hydroxyglutarate oxidase [Paenarthrobacter nicotinovorans]BCW39356.1 hydroxyglutarate oxidase [Arthrobacter sp. StoSoilB3]MBP2393709.1 L-2-hydroxyglutarate oxidase LhgO [Paenarthrobacter nicotinovorans]UKF00045.1 L-2-hydroxyglutarate oxidase [Paenarthrobacter nicotinovorans]UKF04827.1 L-2-hydroxyglutarate oxidase [Paenarthrobacter nicotinovorans]GGV34136.1 hydroxyglutarate oxidase [Paenarthrobacter nicotinovorans]
MKPIKRCAVVGGGIIGVAVARELSNKLDGVQVTVYEKEGRLAAHQTGHNSGVVHAGLYYEPGGLKARLCRRGVELLQEFCAAKALPYEACGKLVIAQTPEEQKRLDNIFARATANGVPGARMLGGDRISEVEPNAVGLSALHSPETAIVDYSAITEALADDVRASGGTIRLGQEVTSVEQQASGAVVHTKDDSEHFDLVVACAGLQSDRLAKAAGEAANPRIVPFFGQYFLLDRAAREQVKGLIYPVPDPRHPFLGVHLTKRIDGEMMLGPNAFISFGRESYGWKDVKVRDVLDYALFPGFWNFARQNVPSAVREFQTVVSRKKFIREAVRFVPSLEGTTVLPGTRGVRAQAMNGDGSLVDDFVIARRRDTVLVRNAPSPGATSSMAIAEYIVEQALAD